MSVVLTNIIFIFVIISSSVLLFFWFKYLKIKIEISNKLLIIYSSVLFLLGGISTSLLYYFEDPKIELIGSEKVNIILNSEFIDDGISAIWHDKDLSNNVVLTNNIDNTKVGNYEVVYKLKFNNKEYIKKREINVLDKVAPEITFEEDDNLSVCPGKTYLDFVYKANDNYDGDISDKVQITKEVIDDTHYNVIYSVKDSSNNETVKTRNIIISDSERPSITLVGKSNRNLMKGYSYKEAGYKAYDSCDGDITNKVVVSGSVDTDTVGTYVISYKVSDNMGNTASASRKITIINPDITQNVIYLTFDDGPSANVTKEILDILKDEGVPATFFLVDFSSNKNHLVQRMANEGHTIGIHGKSHVYKEIYKSVDSYMANIDYMNEKIKNLVGIDTRVTRFPGGSSNTVSRFNPGIMTTLTEEVVKRGYVYFDWNISSGDAGGTTTSSGVYNNVVNGLRYNRSNVVLMHDLNNKTYTKNALRDIIKYGKENGYSFGKLSESIPMVTMKVNN